MRPCSLYIDAELVINGENDSCIEKDENLLTWLRAKQIFRVKDGTRQKQSRFPIPQHGVEIEDNILHELRCTSTILRTRKNEGIVSFAMKY